MADITLLLDSYINGISFKYFFAEIPNYLFLFSLISILFLSDKLNHKEFIFFSIYCLSPFFFNYFLFDPGYFVDQRAYLFCTTSIKNGYDFFNNQFCGFTFNPLSRQVANASAIFSVIPIPTFLTVVAGAFINKLIIIFFYTFYLKKRIFHENLIFIFLIPSLLLYSSLFLRDLPLAIASSIILIELIRGKWTVAPFIAALLIYILLIKPQNAVVFFIFGFVLMISKLFKNDYFFLFLSLGIVFIASFIFQNIILTTINFYVRAFAVEDGATLDSLTTMFEYKSIFFLYLGIVPNFLKALFVPFLWDISGLFQLFQSLENIFIAAVILFLIILVFKKKNTYIAFNAMYLTIYFLGIGLAMYGTIIFNEGSLVRYKFSIVIPFIFAILSLLYPKKEKNAE